MKVEYKLKTKQDFFEDEKRGQAVMNRFYNSRGWEYDRSCSCKKWDLKIKYNGLFYTVEEKYRNEDYGDILIELIQNISPYDPGWYYETEADFLFYVVKEETLYTIKMSDLRDFISEICDNKDKYFSQPQLSYIGFGVTVNVPVKLKYLEKLYKKHDLT